MKVLFKLSVLFFIVIFNCKSAKSAICTALANGNWSNPVNWSCGAVPSCGDLILIPSGITINVDIQVDLDENSSPACSTATFIQVSGVLQFVTGNKISLACGSGVDIMVGGSMLPGGGGGSSNWLKICNIVVWQTSHGPVFGFRHFGSPIPMPVEFISFSINQTQNVTNIKWIVASERENDFFTIEISNDGVNWIAFDNVNSIGDHTDEYTYKREFENLEISTLSYFKLSQTDKNGKSTVLDIKSFYSNQYVLSLFPNPIKTGENLNLSIFSDQEMNTEYSIYTNSGQIFKKEYLVLEKGLNTFQIGISNLNSGIYFVQIANVPEAKVLKLIIQ